MVHLRRVAFVRYPFLIIDEEQSDDIFDRKGLVGLQPTGRLDLCFIEWGPGILSNYERCNQND